MVELTAIDIATINQVEAYLTKNYEFHYNVVNGKIFFRPLGECHFKIYSDRDRNTILGNLLKVIPKANSALLNTVIESNYVKEHDPFESYYSSLPEWDGETDYIGELAKTIETSNPELFKICFKKFIIGTIACQLDGDSVNELVLVLCGGQGVGKTRWARKLIPPKLGQYVYSGTINPSNKDTMINLAENGWIIMDELASFSKVKIESFKDLTSQKKINIRRPYGRYSEELARRASFIGTTNNIDFLVDSTGNRRFLPFEVTKADFLHNVNIDMVYAQGLKLLRDGEPYWLNNKEQEILKEQAKKFEKPSLEEELALKYFAPCEENNEAVFYNATDIIKYLNQKNAGLPMNNSTLQRIGKVMSKNGFKRVKRGEWKYAVKLKEVKAG